MVLYAAYGSNLDPRQMLQRAPHSPQRGTGWLIGWRLTFGGEDRSWEGPLATVVEDPGAPESQVFVAIYDVTDTDAVQMDRWEHADLAMFRRSGSGVATMEDDISAWLYVLDDYEGGLPSARYLGMIADAAEAAGAPDDYVRELRARPCTSVDP